MSRRVGLKRLLGPLAEKKSTMLANKQCCFGEGPQGAQMKSGGGKGGRGGGLEGVEM